MHDLDIQDAIDWENHRQAGLANRYLLYLEEKLLVITESPYIFAIRYDNVRCAIINIFPYLIHYTIKATNHQVIILRVLHTSRKQIW